MKRDRTAAQRELAVLLGAVFNMLNAPQGEVMESLTRLRSIADYVAGDEHDPDRLAVLSDNQSTGP